MCQTKGTQKMKIRDMQRHIEDSLGSLHETLLPPQIGGLRLLPCEGFRPKVRMYYADPSGGSARREVNESADISTFDPRSCEIVITFEPAKDLHSELSAKHKRVMTDYNPIRISGEMMSDTVIRERRESRY